MDTIPPPNDRFHWLDDAYARGADDDEIERLIDSFRLPAQVAARFGVVVGARAAVTTKPLPPKPTGRKPGSGKSIDMRQATRDRFTDLWIRTGSYEEVEAALGWSRRKRLQHVAAWEADGWVRPHRRWRWRAHKNKGSRREQLG